VAVLSYSFGYSFGWQHREEPFQLNIVRLPIDRHYLSNALPKLQEFVKEVETYKQVGIRSHPLYPEYLKMSQEPE